MPSDSNHLTSRQRDFLRGRQRPGPPTARVLMPQAPPPPPATLSPSRFQHTLSSVSANWAFFCMVAVGLICAVDRNEENATAPFSVAITAVAAVHYYAIVDARTRASVDAQPGLVDRIRYSDWFVTLPIMAYEMRMLGMDEDALLPRWPSPLLAAATIAFGGVWRFADAEAGRWGAFLASCAFAGLLIIDLVLASLEAHDGPWLLAIVGVFCLYPVIATVPLSIATRDAAFAFVDVFSKCGLALVSVGVLT